MLWTVACGYTNYSLDRFWSIDECIYNINTYSHGEKEQRGTRIS